jgi:endonuclease V-like protein UPF0215 family
MGNKSEKVTEGIRKMKEQEKMTPEKTQLMIDLSSVSPSIARRIELEFYRSQESHVFLMKDSSS